MNDFRDVMKETFRRTRRRVYHISWVKHVRQEFKILRKYGQFRPEQVLLPGAANAIFLNPNEPRARSILVNLGRRQQALRDLWQRAASSLEPSIVIDVGLNYGEFLFTTSYGRRARLIGIEANERLRPWCEKSRQAHSNAAQIELHFALAGEHDADDQVVYIDPRWSGRSSALPPAANARLARHKVRSVAVDSLFAGCDLTNETVLFKIDVEGFEPKVLKGMRRLSAECRRCVGLIELNGRSLATVGLDLESYMRILSEWFTVYSLGTPGKSASLETASTQIVPRGTSVHDLETNLLVVSDESLLAKLGLTVLASSP